jgi:hypothetical protein
MARSTRRWLLAILTTVTTAALVWLPVAAQAGITVTGLE